MAAYTYDVSAISADISKLNALANKPVGELVIETQNIGDMADKVVNELVPQLNALHVALNKLISATATATQATLNVMIQLDEDFVEITESNSTVGTSDVRIDD